MLQRFVRPAQAVAACLALVSAVACSSNSSLESPNAPSPSTTAHHDEPVDPPPPPPKGGEGCTPGFWKQAQHLDSWVGYSTGASFNTTFGVTTSPDTTLLQSLGANGGGVNALKRHATAALLNSAATGSVSFDMTSAQVIAAVQAALADGGDIEGTKNILAGFNEQGCPLS
jgi:hypothetical protein